MWQKIKCHVSDMWKFVALTPQGIGELVFVVVSALITGYVIVPAFGGVVYDAAADMEGLLDKVVHFGMFGFFYFIPKKIRILGREWYVPVRILSGLCNIGKEFADSTSPDVEDAVPAFSIIDFLFGFVGYEMIRLTFRGRR